MERKRDRRRDKREREREKEREERKENDKKNKNIFWAKKRTFPFSLQKKSSFSLFQVFDRYRQAAE